LSTYLFREEFKKRFGKYPHEYIADHLTGKLKEVDREAEIVRTCDAVSCRVFVWLDYQNTILFAYIYANLFEMPDELSVHLLATRMADINPYLSAHAVERIPAKDMLNKLEYVVREHESRLKMVLSSAASEQTIDITPYVDVKFATIALDLSRWHFAYERKASSWLLAQLSVI